MLTWKQYFPDQGLTQVIAMEQYEYDSFWEYIYQSIELLTKDKPHDVLMRIKRLRESKEPIFLNKNQEWDSIIMKKYGIDESLGFIGTMKHIEKCEVTSKRFEIALQKYLDKIEGRETKGEGNAKNQG